MPLGAFHPPDPLKEATWLHRERSTEAFAILCRAAICRHPVGIDVVLIAAAKSSLEFAVGCCANRFIYSNFRLADKSNWPESIMILICARSQRQSAFCFIFRGRKACQTGDTAAETAKEIVA